MSDYQTCDVCKTKFYEQPAVLIGVPDEDSKAQVYNVCPVCFDWIVNQGAEK